MPPKEESLWSIVLAAGEGTRLASLTGRLYGAPLPKQFASIVDDRSLLQDTVARLSAVIPASRTVVVVPACYEELAHVQLSPWPGVRVIAQPANLDTGPGVLLPLASVLDADADASVAVVPSDHFIPRPAPVLDAIERGVRAADDVPLTLLGVAPDAPETEYGWIVPGRVLPEGLREVVRFVEKPTLPVARELQREGALWNTFIMVGRARTLWDLTAREMPEHAARIATCTRARNVAGALGRAYRALGPVNFSHAVLERTPGIAIATVRGSGWCDWGSPERVFASLRGTPHLDALARRFQSAPAMVARPRSCADTQT